MHALVEALGVPLVQLPATLQELLPSFQVVEGPLKLPHCDRTDSAEKDTDSRRTNQKGRERRLIQDHGPFLLWVELASNCLRIFLL